MNFTLPHTIENGQGEKITFTQIIDEPGGPKVLVESCCKPGGGPIMHVHYKQDEAMTLVSGKMTYQVLGEEPVSVAPAQTVTFMRNQPHRFWNAGDDDLHLTGWVKPANSIIFFLTTLYAAQKKAGSRRPESFDGAYLIVRYKNEYGLPLLPAFVKRVVMPFTYQVGKMLGKYRKFKDAPQPL